ncbi:hormogonium polysaccharide biosynthesis protein HpsA [uncultured Nostoc sp.]|uniref:hormogonium polysaccharide biosynthesis protein HpsA n=1 Tax=uncultured Nostoc sp. TaxID=340711 RepID=UPI0035C9D17A
MSIRRKLFKAGIFCLRKLSTQFLSTIKKQIVWLIKAIFTTNRRRGTANAGFVLPTVAMVSLVVVLLTIAILFRSFERSKNASNVRVNEAALNAATPAIDRSRAKLNKLFQDGRLPRATPTDDALYSTLTTNIDEYTFGDETQLKLIKDSAELKTAWLYPVDTDNNGKFDSYTLYGIYFKNPPISSGAYTRARNSLEARTPPMTAGGVSGDCGDTLGTSATLVGNTGWFNIGGKLKKSFFAYTATVPITGTPADTNNYEPYKGNKGFSALEYQQDRVQLPVVNNAVIYEDDINLTPGPAFKLNGRIFTNSNFLTGGGSGITLYQVSSKASCFYEADNAKILIGGNTAAGGFTDDSDQSPSTKVHLFQGTSTNPTESNFQKSVTESPRNIAYNSLAYVQRINRLVSAQMTNDASTDPTEVSNGINQEYQKRSLTAADFTAAEQAQFRKQQLELYFKKRTRRVPFTEVPFNSELSVVLGTYETTTSPLNGSGDTLRPPDLWIYPTDPSDGKTTGSNYTQLTLNTASGGTKLLPDATEPTTLQKDPDGKEAFLGDRISVGNNLPQLWWNGTSFVGPNPQDTQNITGITWNNTGGGDRTRRTRVEQLADLGATNRDGDWELAAAKVPTNPQDPVGGLRVVTSGGIYLPSRYTTIGRVADVANSITADADFSTAASVTTNIWSDMMPVASPNAATNTSIKDNTIVLANGSSSLKSGITTTVRGSKTDQQLLDEYTPYLRMRATAVYHYNIASYNSQTPAPIACVSSYYDPTKSTSAINKEGLPNASPIGSDPSTNVTAANAGNSNNGVVYNLPADFTTSETTYANILNYQKDLKYPNGRWVNEPLKNALAKGAADRTISQRSAVESALCAIQILDGTISVQGTPAIPHGAIMETAFLDPRQVKAIHADESTSGVETFTNADGYTLPNGTIIKASVANAADYNLAFAARQPLEIRATVLDIDKLRGKTISGGVATTTEYLLPNSGIIYATRDDALLDASATGVNQTTVSPVDYILDPTRRPNAIMLVNGGKIWRTNSYRDTEKGLILASNLPVYVKGDFNLHTQQEFITALQDDWDNFYTRTDLNINFACRSGDPRLQNCATGDEWRPASVIADAVTLLSNSFLLGFRNQGDYDLNNNLGDTTSITNFKNNGFLTNAYVTNANWYNSSGIPNIFSSYLNNFVTPIQRRGNFNEYLMEVCPKLPVSACTAPTDWKVKLSPNGTSWDINGDGTNVSILGQSASGLETTATTVNPKYPRRVAFKRDTSGNLVIDSADTNTPKRPIPLGIDDSSGNVAEFPYSVSSFPRKSSTALWFETNDSNNSADKSLSIASSAPTLQAQPRLSQVLQINVPFGSPGSPDSSRRIGPGSGQTPNHYNWLQLATSTTFNLAAAAGDTPARSNEDNGGLHNFVRFIENWNSDDSTANATPARISGSFIQFKRSAFATGPFTTTLSGAYPIVGNSGQAPFYIAPKRQWGYDVALLSQSPDLFAQKLVRTPDDLPDEYFREVGRDDSWVATLLCAKKTDDTYAIDADQRRCN